MNLGQLLAALAALAMLNHFTSGWVQQEAGTVWAGRGQGVTEGLGCLVAANVVAPVGRFGGFAYFVPGIDDIVAAILLAAVAIKVVEDAFQHPTSGLEKIAFLFVAWLALKTLSLYLVYSIPGCPLVLETGNNILGPIQTIAVIAVPILIYKFVRKKK
jgi:hypothetical protein